MQPRFDIDVDDEGSLLVLCLCGELDLATVPVVHDIVARHCSGRRALVLDLRALTFMDSSGLRLLIELQDRRDGTRVAFIAPGPRVGTVLDMTGVRSTLNWVTDPSQALTDPA
jgi:anti-anti-sigma factor